jgi:GTP-binding protein HflX
LRGEIFTSCEVLEERTQSEGTSLRVRGDSDAVKRLQEQLGVLPGAVEK